MKRKLFMFMFILLGAILLVACGDNTAKPTFDGNPTVELGQVAGQLDLHAKSKGEEGKIFYAIFPSSVTTKTASEITGGEGSVSKGGSNTNELSVTVTLEHNTEYAVFFVVRENENFSDVKRVVKKTAEQTATVGFSQFGFTGGASDGTVVLNARSNGLGSIYYVLVEEGSDAPTAAQIKAGVDYGSVLVVDSGNSQQFENHIIDDLTPAARYTIYVVVEHEGNFSAVRNNTTTATLYVPPVDKGEGTLENPFKVSTVEDLEQIGQGFYEVDGKEWNVFNYYVLENDIDLTTKYGEGLASWEPLGADAAGARFEGMLDGQGYKIIGLYIDAESSIVPYKGFFASSEATAVVKNLTFLNPYVHASGIGESDSNHGAGVVFGYLKGSVDNIQIINGVVEDKLNGTRVGGVAGRAYVTGSITNSYINVDVSGYNRVGGLLGVADTSDQGTEPIVIENVVFKGSVVGTDQHIGGLVGYARAVQISNVFVTGYVQGARDTGGVLGFLQKRAGNNNVTASIEDVVVHVTVYGTGSSNTIGSVIGNRSLSGIEAGVNDHLLVIGDLWEVEGTLVVNGGSGTSINGEVITTLDVSDQEWFEENIPNWNFEVFEIGETNERPVLIGTLDDGILLELEMPLVVISAITPGVNELELKVDLSSNQANSIIHYIVVGAAGEYSASDILNPEGVLFHGSGEVISTTHVMENYDKTYYVYFVVVLEDETVSDVFAASGKSKEMEALVITGGLRPGANNKEIIISLQTQLEATIYYIIVDAEGEFSVEQIKDGSLGIFSGNGLAINNVVHLMPEENATYYFYAYAETLNKDRNAEASGEGLSSSAEVVHYGSGTVADPYIIRTIDDFEAIGRGAYIIEGQTLAFSNEAHYVLNNDIDLSSDYGEGKLSWTPIPGDFKGSLNGAGFEVTGLYININENIHAGLFNRINGGSVRNLTLDNATVVNTFEGSDGNSSPAGILVGRINSAVLENITITNSLINTNTFRVGLLVGSVDGGADTLINNVYAQGEVIAAGRAGGLIGSLTNDLATPIAVENIVLSVKVTLTRANSGNGRAGGLVGWARGIGIKNAYVEAFVVGTIGGNIQTGGVLGYVETQSGTNLNANIENVLAHVVVVGHSSNTNTIYGGAGSGKVPASSNIFQTRESLVIAPGSPAGSSLGGVVVPEVLDNLWFETNLAELFVENGWEMLEGYDRPALVGQPDNGLINELEIPLLTFANVSEGLLEKELKLDITTNKDGAVVYFVVLAEEAQLTSEGILTPEDVLFSGNGEVISETFVMPSFNTEYFIYYVVQLSDESLSEVFMVSGSSKAMTELVISGGLRPGEANKELIINLSTNLPSNIFYIIVDLPGEYSASNIKNPEGVLFSGNGSVIDNVSHIMALEDEEYYFYAVAEAIDRSSIVTSGSGRSKSAEVINYGSGTEADPFIIRSVNDLAAIGRGTYNGNGIDLSYSNTAYYLLNNNIDLSLSYGEGLLSWTPITTFKGQIDGAGFKISGLYINETGEGRKGFIGQLDSGAVVKNLHIEDATLIVDGTTSNHNNAAGILAGRVNDATVENIIITNGVVISERERVGGLIGSAPHALGYFNNLYVEATVSGPGRVGGIFGMLGDNNPTNNHLSNAVFKGEVSSSGENRMGGAIGVARAVNISNLYVEAIVTTENDTNQSSGAIGYFQKGTLDNELTNVLVNVKVAHGNTGRVGLVTVKGNGDNPTLEALYHTLASRVFGTGSNSINGAEIDVDADSAWFATNMPGFSTENGWEFKEGAQRPTLIGTPDEGLFKIFE